MNGTPPVVFRPLMPDDAERLLKLYEGLSAESRFYRFQTYTEHLDESTLRAYAQQFAQVNYQHDFALAACLRQQAEEEIIGVARYMRPSEKVKSAEFAIVVRDDWQGKGLGHALMLRLCIHAHAQGICRLYGTFIGHNEGIVRLLVRLVPSDFLKIKIEDGEGHVCIHLKDEWLLPYRKKIREDELLPPSLRDHEQDSD
ncbi:GNAT family N-acetyltransferase [Thermonema rossianum]|uniref:GNAT family N-acetyltransferase n=1 Tax=Thermonema rossianum TaxID=55505 RepID=UPI00056DEA80|nr:GNAT family N-acetyltransferase [Thermonema rossianum]